MSLNSMVAGAVEGGGGTGSGGGGAPSTTGDDAGIDAAGSGGGVAAVLDSAGEVIARAGRLRVARAAGTVVVTGTSPPGTVAASVPDLLVGFDRQVERELNQMVHFLFIRLDDGRQWRHDRQA